MFKLNYTKKFKKDLVLLKKRGYNFDILKDAIILLEKDGELGFNYYSHKLHGHYNGFFEAHLKSDWLIIWKKDDKIMEIHLVRTGTHSDLF
jgi:mRNA interferase YafQ